MTDRNVREVELTALEYLRATLGDRAPDYITLEREFHEAPLDGEGRALLFSFALEPGPGVDRSAYTPADLLHYVVAGETEPNFFPAYGFDAEQGYSVHVGTRFMLVMRVEKVDVSNEPPGARPALEQFIASYAADATVEGVELAALFRCHDDYFAAYRIRLNGANYYCFGADCPPGAYELTHLPPQAALRLHLGQVIRAEARHAGTDPEAQHE